MQPDVENLSPETVAVISAAVNVAIGRQAQIKRIRYRKDTQPTMWANQGRVSIMEGKTMLTMVSISMKK